MKRVAVIISFIIACCFMVNVSYAIGEDVENTTQKTVVKVSYEYKEVTNTVIATMSSNNELKDTKISWKLSEDKKKYIFEFANNTNYMTNVVDIYGKIIPVQINVTQVDESPAQITVSYDYLEESNSVIATIKSNRKLKDTKPTWELSEDKKQYKKIFTSNTAYSTPVEDIYGNVISISLNITLIDENPVQVTVSYEFLEEANSVIATMISNRKLKDTKPTWELSEDQKQYTKVFTRNTAYSTPVEDIYGNIISVQIDVTQVDEEPAQVTVIYDYQENTNTVIATMVSNKALKNTKVSWKLSEDKKQYTFEFGDNTKYVTNVEDLYGNIIPVQINVTQINTTIVQVTYEYKVETNSVIATITSNNELKDTKKNWIFSDDKKQYTFEFINNTSYTTKVEDKYGKVISVPINVKQIRIDAEVGIYGQSGAKIHGVAGGSDLEYYKFGYGENVLFATFCVHGYEDGWDRDGEVLVHIANDFFSRLMKDQDGQLAKDWTIYIFKEVNPDGRRLGTTNNGAGRTTLYSKIGKGIDLNRCWPTEEKYIKLTNKRNYNGTAPFQAYEAEALANFLQSHKSKNGKTILIDLHGWQEQLIGDEEICKYYKEQYTSCATHNYGKYGQQYLIGWAKQQLGAQVALVELPVANNLEEVYSMRLSEKYINATWNMLKNEV